MSFETTANKGFRMSFSNGFSISIQWGTENYCNNRSLSSGLEPMEDRFWDSKDAEIAVFNRQGRMIEIASHDHVIGYASSDFVASAISLVSNAKNEKELISDIKQSNEKKSLIDSLDS